MEGVRVAGLGGAEDHRRAGDQRDDVADGPDVRADRHAAHAETGAHAGGVHLIDDAADHEDEDTAGLIALDGLHGLFNARRGADHDDEAGDVAGDQRNAQLTHFRVGEVAVILRSLVGGGGAGVFAGFDHFRAARGGDAGIEDGLGAILAAHHGAQLAQRFLQLAQLGDLLAQIGVDAGQEVSGVGHGHRGVLAQFGDGGVQLGFRFEVHLIGATEYSIKQSHLFSHSFHDQFFSLSIRALIARISSTAEGLTS